MADNNNILFNDDELSEELLMKYLEGNLSDEERFKVEAGMVDSNFVNDAVEGLEFLHDKKNIQQSVTELNRQLQKQIDAKKKRKLKRKLPSMEWMIIYVVIVILLCLLGFAVIHMHYKHKNNTEPRTEIKK